jgi:hypothetical protein
MLIASFLYDHQVIVQMAIEPSANGKNATLGLKNKYAPVNAKKGHTIARNKVPKTP